MTMFRLENATVRYNGKDVLKEVSFAVGRGERVALVGKSGAGKSSLLKLLYEQKRDDTALIPQELGLVRTLTVFHNVYMGRLHRHSAWYNLVNLIRPMGREVDAVRRVIRGLGLEDKIMEPVGELSGGQQQRTAVGRAVHQNNPVLLGDEPVSALDGHQARDVLESINAAHETVVLAMHDVRLAIAYTDRVIGLKDGRVVMDQPTSGMVPSDFDRLYQD